MIEIALVEHFYGKRLREEPLPASNDYPISEARQPTCADLERLWTGLAQETRATLVGITDGNRTVTRRIEQEDKIIVTTAAKADVATQLLLHEFTTAPRRWRCCATWALEAQNLDYSVFAAKREEFPKDAASGAEPRGFQPSRFPRRIRQKRRSNAPTTCMVICQSAPRLPGLTVVHALPGPSQGTPHEECLAPGKKGNLS